MKQTLRTDVRIQLQLNKGKVVQAMVKNRGKTVAQG